MALHHLTTTKYTLTDARSRREPAAYVQSILCYAIAANIDKVEIQLTCAYINLAPELQMFLDPPDDKTTVGEFIENVEGRKKA